jgi:hypothetical protein
VARKRQPHERKLRTREHVIADLAVNFVERQILLRNFAVNRLGKDYGFDLLMLTFNEHGEVESGHVLFQVKATDFLQVLKGGESISIRVAVADLKTWQDESMPVILVLYDGRQDRAFWLYVQQYLDEKQVSLDDLSMDQDRVILRIPVKNQLNPAAIEQFQQYRIVKVERKGVSSNGP